MRVRLTPSGESTLLELEHSGVPLEIIPNASPDMWGLGAGWEIGLMSLGEFLGGARPEGGAVDRMAAASAEDQLKIAELAEAISTAWPAVIAAER